MDESPCINECELDDEGNCLGCGRTVEEITSWQDMTEEQRVQVIERLNEEKGENIED